MTEEATANIIISFKNVTSMVNNSIFILNDIDLMLGEKGFSSIHGNTIGSEHSKNIVQPADQYSCFYPNYMSRYYYNSKRIDSGGKDNLVFAVNIQFYHPNQNEMAPALVSGVFKIKSSFEDRPVGLNFWLLKYAAYESGLSKEFKPNRNEYILESERDKIILDYNIDYIRFWGTELLNIQNAECIQSEVIGKLFHIYNSSN